MYMRYYCSCKIILLFTEKYTSKMQHYYEEPAHAHYIQNNITTLHVHVCRRVAKCISILSEVMTLPIYEPSSVHLLNNEKT